MVKIRENLYSYLLLFVLLLTMINTSRAQSRYTVELKENWIVNEAKPEFKSGKAIPQDLHNPGNGWNNADMPAEEYLGDVAVRTTLNGDYSRASVSIFPDIQGKGTSKIRYSLASPSGEIIKEATISRCDSFAIQVAGPELWQPYTHGKPLLYRLNVSLINSNLEIDKKAIPVGIREVLLVQKDDKTGEDRFGFRINGQMIFMRGGCWAPLEGMTHVWNAQRANKLPDIFQAGNLNFIRVCGEGEIPDDTFYEECDRRGILVWQEFMTGNGMQFPLDDTGYKENFREEITDNIKRLRNHPAIIIWCGGNEHYLSNRVEVENKKLPVGRELFEVIMPELVRKYDPGRTFHPSSPWGGKDWDSGNYPLEGDFHDYTTLRFMPLSTVPLFTTEVCMVSPYSANSMRRFISEEELWPAGYSFKIDKPGKIAWPEAWQYHSVTSSWQKIGRIQDYLDVQNADDLCRVLGTAHGEYLTGKFGNQTVSQLLWTEKFLSLPEATIVMEKSVGGVVMKSNKFVKDVALSIPNTSGAVFDDNYFNLLPGVGKYVKVTDSAGGESIIAKGVNSNRVEIPLL